MSELGELLKKLRGKKALRTVAEETGLSHSYISDIEKGFRRGTKTPINPSPDTLKRLAQAYDHPYEDLMKSAGYLPDAIFEDNDGAKYVIEVKSKTTTPDALAIIKDYIDKKGGAEQFGFFDIEEWKDLTPEQVEEVLQDFDYMFQRAKKRNEEKE